MSTPLYLTAEERTVFEKLPADLRRNWIVMDETLTCYETERQLKIRRDIFRKKDPAFRALIGKLEGMNEPATIDEVTAAIGPLPKSLVLSLLFVMGAGFLRDCIANMINTAQAAVDLQPVAELSGLRHLLFEANLTPTS